MPQSNLLYDTPQNRHIASLLREMDEKHWHVAGHAYEPTMFQDRISNYHGAKIGGGAPQTYITSGNSPAFPPAHFHNGQNVRLNGGDYSIGDFGRDLGTAVKTVAPLAPLLMGLGHSGGRLARATSVARRVKRGRKAMFEGLPNTPAPRRKKAAAAEVPVVIEAVAPVVNAPRRGRRRKGGFGLSDVMDVAKPVAKELGAQAIQKGADYLVNKLSGSGATGARAKRAAIVKQVMKEKGLKMIEASKYVKTHGLY